ncbi:TBC1 domain family member 10A [Oopsacas minuta]|uniref:TBC1 domain family member 10A n=1 Tax=Oopsacas minuta TaxID=111878 RepID=A0AAV7JEC7_9METZ|nr:TBC1 domain family member 10A [Oopsacas minuta]
MAYDTGNAFSEPNLAKVPLKNNTDRFGFDFTADEVSYDYCIPVQVLRKRELKWNRMLKKFDKFKKKHPDLLKSRCRKGIPYSMRGLAWFHLSGANIMEDKNKGLFEKLHSQQKPECEKDIGMIMKDLHRTFPKHELFSTPEGQTTLQQILTALMAYKPEHGYCQAMAPVVATLLMHMPVESAFWVMVMVMESYLPSYYTEGFQVFQIDCELFDMLMSVYAPNVSKYLQSIGALSVVYLLEWYMCIFCRTLPFSCALRIYDMFFCEGPIVMHKTAISLMKLYMEKDNNYLNFPTISDFYPALKHLPEDATHETVLIPTILSIKLGNKLLTKMQERAAKKFKIVEDSRQINRMQHTQSITNLANDDGGDTSDEGSVISAI